MRILVYSITLAIFGLALAGCFGTLAQLDSASKNDSHKSGAKSFNDVITLSFVGDNVLGDYYGSKGQTFNWQFENLGGDYEYFFAQVRPILAYDDMTLGNLEGPLTTHNEDRLEKLFAFKGDPAYIQILKSGSVEAVNIANNHTRDYGMQGFRDTQKHLQEAGIGFSGEGILHIYEIRGIKVGMAGHRGWSLGIKPQVKKEIIALRELGADIVIFSFHWGEERVHYPNQIQQEIGRFAIDNGADIVIGHHPHVLQGIEEYKGKKIIYSLGNFVYGGAKNPPDKDSIIYQVRFGFGKGAQKLKKLGLKGVNSKGDSVYIEKVRAFVEQESWSELHSFVPVLISGEKERNNYQPIIAQGEDKVRILERMETYSAGLDSASSVKENSADNSELQKPESSAVFK